MSNHVHLVAVPGHAKSLALALSEAHSRYSLEWNPQRDSVGHLWQNRFLSSPLEAQRTRMRVAKQRQEPTFFARRA
jgi:putative transposase